MNSNQEYYLSYLILIKHLTFHDKYLATRIHYLVISKGDDTKYVICTLSMYAALSETVVIVKDNFNFLSYEIIFCHLRSQWIMNNTIFYFDNLGLLIINLSKKRFKKKEEISSLKFIFSYLSFVINLISKYKTV